MRVWGAALCSSLTLLLSSPCVRGRADTPAPAVVNAPGISVTFPERGDYSFWVCSALGQVTTTPITARDRDSALVPAETRPGDILYILDLTTGRIAAMPLSVDNFGRAAAVNLLRSDFTLEPRGDGGNRPPMLGHAGDRSPGSNAAGFVSAPAADYWGGLFFAFLFGAGFAAVCGWYAVRAVRRSLAELLPESSPARRRASAVDLSLSTSSSPEPPAPAPVRVTRFGERVGRGHKKHGLSYLVGTQGIVSGSRFALTAARITIGRDEENDIAVVENTVSRHHATLLRNDTGAYSVVDEESANGIYVNGMRTQRAVLQPGDEIKIGDCYFRLDAD